MRKLMMWFRSIVSCSAATAAADASLQRNARAISATPTPVVRKRTPPPLATSIR